MKRKFVQGAMLVAAAAAFTLFVSGCRKKEQEIEDSDIYASRDVTEYPQYTPTPTETENPIPEGMMQSYLSGELVSQEAGLHRPIAVMLNNIRDAVPQTGISWADVVYEAPVEGDITRLMGIFENYDGLEKIGSVRSCREYYLFFAQEFEAIYAHYGQAIYAKPFLEEDFIQNLSGLEQYSKDIFYRTSDRVAPHNAYTSYDGIQKGIEDYGYDPEHSKSYHGHYLFADMDTEETLESGSTADVVRLNCYQTNRPWFEYDADAKKYLRFQYGEKQIDDATDEQLSYDNLLIQYHSYKPYDQNGYLNIDAISGGKGMYITRGKAVDIRWEKDAVWGVTHYIDENEQEIRLNRGKTWVAIVLDDDTDKILIEEPPEDSEFPAENE